MEELILMSESEAKAVLERQPSYWTLTALSELFKLFGDPTRLRILSLLADGAVCVRDLAALLELSDSAVSHQLRILKQGKLIRSRRDGKNVVYTLADDHVRILLQNGLDHVGEK